MESTPPEFDREAVVAAAREGHRDCVRFLVKSGLLLEDAARGEEAKSLGAFLEACQSSDFDSVLTWMCDEDNRDQINRRGSDLASTLVISGCPVSCLEGLVNRGVEVHVHNTLDFSLLCAVLVENIECMEFLLKHRVKTNAGAAINCHESLLLAASFTRADCLKTMLKFCTENDIKRANTITTSTSPLNTGVDQSIAHSHSLLFNAVTVSVKTEFQHSIIEYAAQSGDLDCLRFILENVPRESPKSSLEERNNLEHIVKNTKMLRLVLGTVEDFKSFISRPNGVGLLQTASSMGCMESVQLLLDLDLDVDASNNRERNGTPLFLACQYHHEKVVELLIKSGANVDCCHKGVPVVILAADGRDNEKCLQLLVDANANLDVEDRDGYTVFTAALATEK